MMKIVVVSNTHIPKRAKSLPARLTEKLVQADIIFGLIYIGDSIEAEHIFFTKESENHPKGGNE
ncbi:hypothetical protein G6549_18570 [Bacillus sp. MM2020_1]|nr:hypothetical protein [Bacillus sp. MM2020_1]